MKLMEVNGQDQDSLIDVKDDEFRKAEITDTRRPRLTLAHLGKLRKMREIRKLENEERKELFSRIYARPTAQE